MLLFYHCRGWRRLCLTSSFYSSKCCPLALTPACWRRVSSSRTSAIVHNSPTQNIRLSKRSWTYLYPAQMTYGSGCKRNAVSFNLFNMLSCLTMYHLLIKWRKLRRLVQRELSFPERVLTHTHEVCVDSTLVCYSQWQIVPCQRTSYAYYIFVFIRLIVSIQKQSEQEF